MRLSVRTVVRSGLRSIREIVGCGTPIFSPTSLCVILAFLRATINSSVAN